MRKIKEITINPFFIIFAGVAIILALQGLVSWWVILLIVLGNIEVTFKFPIKS